MSESLERVCGNLERDLDSLGPDSIENGALLAVPDALPNLLRAAPDGAELRHSVKLFHVLRLRHMEGALVQVFPHNFKIDAHLPKAVAAPVQPRVVRLTPLPLHQVA